MVVAGGVISVALSSWAVFRIVDLEGLRIEALSADLLTLAGVFGIPTLTFGVWMCWRRIGFTVCRYLSVGFGGIGVSAWPLMDYATV